MAAAASATTAKGADAPAPLGSPAQSKPNRLIVDEASNDDNSVVAMHPKKMELLDLYRGDTVRISSSEGRDTVCIVLADNSCDEGRVRMTQVVRNNLGVRLSDAVFVHPCTNLQYGKKIRVQPFADSLGGVSSGVSLLDAYLLPYFNDAYRPVRQGDTLVAPGRGGTGSVEFKVVETDPPECCIVGPDTEVLCDAAPLGRQAEEEQEARTEPQDKGDASAVTMSISALSMSATSVSAAAAPSPARGAAPAVNDAQTPPARVTRTAADSALAPPSPAIEVLTRDEERSFDRKVTFESSTGVIFKSSVKCDFKAKVFTFTPDVKLESVGKVKLRLSDVKTYALLPALRKLTLTLKEASVLALSPAAGVLPATLGTVISITFATDKSFLELKNEVEKTLVFRSGTFDNDFVVVNNTLLGTGGNAQVFLVRRRGAPADAIGYADKRPLKAGVSFAAEAAILKECIGCDFITRMVQFYPACDGSCEHLILERMEGGDLMNDVLLRRKSQRGQGTPWVSDEEVRIVVWRVLRALEFMHHLSPGGASILHRDIKPDNVFLARLGADGCGDCSTAKLADLGHAKELDGVSRTYTTTVGTAEYMPPEYAAAQLTHKNVGHTKSLDMWTVGVLIYVCFAHEYPYGGAGDRKHPDFQFYMNDLNKRIMSKGLQGTGPEALHALLPPGSEKAALVEKRSAHGRALMTALMQREPTHRLDVQSALQHEWFAGITTAAEGVQTP